jgi:hypothetical protein
MKAMQCAYELMMRVDRARDGRARASSPISIEQFIG